MIPLQSISENVSDWLGLGPGRQPGTRSSLDTNHPTWNVRVACVMASAIPPLMALTIVILRGGYPTPTTALIKLAGISLLVINVSAFGAQDWRACGPLLSLLALLAVAALGLSPLGTRPSLAAVLALAGVASCISNLAAVAARCGVVKTVGLLSLGLFLGVYAESMYWRENAAHQPLYPEAIVAGRVNTDVLEQAAVVSMIAAFRTASTGLDGLVPLKYHNGSLWLAEALRRLCGFRAVDFIAFGYGVVLIPLYVAAFASCALDLRAALRLDSSSFAPAFWAYCAVALVGIFPFTNNPMNLDFNETIINSDSFLLVIALSLLIIAIGARLYLHVCSGNDPLTRSEQLIVAIALPAVLGLIGFVKISQLYLLWCVMAYLCWRLRWLRSWPYLVGIGASGSLLAYMLFSELGANKASFAPLLFDRIHPEWVPYFFVLYFASAWFLLAVWARFAQVRTLGDFREALRTGCSMPVELVFVTVIAGVVPYLLLNFYSPSWKFFTEFHAVLAGAFLVAFLGDLAPRNVTQRIRDGSLPLSTLLALGLALAVAGHMCMTTLASVYRVLKDNGEVRSVLAGAPASEWRHQLKQLKTRQAMVSPTFAPREQVMACLSGIGRESVGSRRTAALYIPKTNRAYWDMRQTGDGATPFIAPAVAGLPMIDGLPEYEDIGWAQVGWGYPQYHLPSAPAPPMERLAEAIEKARNDGFRILIVFRGVSSSGCELHQIKLE